MKVRALTAGSVVQSRDGLEKATCIGVIEKHPVWNQLSLVIWVLDSGEVSLDALHPLQEVGTEVNICGREELRALLVGRNAENGRSHTHPGDDDRTESSG